VRGKKIREKVLKAINGLEGATGGGHEDAVGAQVRVEDLEKFRERLEEQV
jgi:single-stranded DNA-specific DHH superfamily exonuclease